MSPCYLSLLKLPTFAGKFYNWAFSNQFYISIIGSLMVYQNFIFYCLYLSYKEAERK